MNILTQKKVILPIISSNRTIGTSKRPQKLDNKFQNTIRGIDKILKKRFIVQKSTESPLTVF